MVEDTGETVRASAYKPINAPESVQVKEDMDGLPVAVKYKWLQRVENIDDRWRIDDEWWRQEPVSRLYFAIRLASGQKLVIYKNLVTGGWYRQSY